MKDKKPFKETALGKFIGDKIPKVAKLIGESIPDKGVLGFIRNMVMNDPEVPPEVAMQFDKLAADHEREMYALEIEDRDSARNREANFIKAAGHIDWMQTAVGITVMLTFLGALLLIGFKTIPEGSEHLMINAIGIMEGMVLSVVGYYYGSSAGSRMKDMKKP